MVQQFYAIPFALSATFTSSSLAQVQRSSRPFAHCSINEPLDSLVMFLLVCFPQILVSSSRFSVHVQPVTFPISYFLRAVVAFATSFVIVLVRVCVSIFVVAVVVLVTLVAVSRALVVLVIYSLCHRKVLNNFSLPVTAAFFFILFHCNCSFVDFCVFRLAFICSYSLCVFWFFALK